MATADDADKAIKKLNQYQIGHKRLKVAFSLPSGERTRNINLYIKVRGFFRARIWIIWMKIVVNRLASGVLKLNFSC
jgi:hypothetical protein